MSVTKNKLQKGYFGLLLIIVIRNGKKIWRHSHIKCCILCWNLAKFTENTGYHFSEHMAVSKEDQLLGGDLHAIPDKTEVDMLQISKK